MPCPNGRAAVAALLALIPAGVGGAAEAPPPTIAVTGEAEAEVPPDTALLTLGVESEQRTAAAAADEIATKAAAMMAVLRASGIDGKDVGTAGLSLEPLFADEAGARRSATPAPRGFRASTTYRVKVRPAERAGEVAAKLVERGANTIEGIDYAVADRAARLDALRAEAMRDARRKAAVYVEALDLRLGAVSEIVPGEADEPPRPMMSLRAAAPAAAKVASIPAAPGLITLRATVQVRWQLAP